MVTFYTHDGKRFSATDLSQIDTLPSLNVITWVDLLQPTSDEILEVKRRFNVDLPSKNEREEIEISSRYWEDSRTITINSYFFVSFFFVDNTKSHYNESVSFVLQENILFTVREKELQTFDNIRRILTAHPKELFSGYDIFMQIFDIRIDQDADLLEYAARESDEIRKQLLWDSGGQSVDTLRKISTLQEFTLKVRQSVFDKRRIVTALAKSSKISPPIRTELSIMIKDLNSLVEFITINGNTLDNLQNLFLAQTNIEQNKIIKLFTVANVVLMPPTLIASIYGMNFHFIPELGWSMGYPFSLVLMAVAGAVPLIYFRKKGWL
ncbi:MAG: magnesium/cobalt transporter CorA [Sulfuricurvum sp.]|nr:magnesium/cobalt transporter CorA [Sulfuricurvum sp.]